MFKYLSKSVDGYYETHERRWSHMVECQTRGWVSGPALYLLLCSTVPATRMIETWKIKYSIVGLKQGVDLVLLNDQGEHQSYRLKS